MTSRQWLVSVCLAVLMFGALLLIVQLTRQPPP